MLRNVLLLFVTTLILGVAIGYFFGFGNGIEKGEPTYISSFEECKAAGYPINGSYPEQCNTPDGKHFVQDVEETTPEEETPVTPVVPRNPGAVKPEPVFCTMDAKICPDGTGVGRVGPNCEFAPCPGE